MYKKDLYGKTIRKKIVFHGGFYMFGLIIALISGALMSIQGVFNTEVTKQSSTWTTSTFVQATGFLACLLIWLIAERDQSFTMLLKVSPRYLLLGGVIGAAITFTVIKSVSDGFLLPFPKGQTASFALVADDYGTLGIALHHQ